MHSSGLQFMEKNKTGVIEQEMPALRLLKQMQAEYIILADRTLQKALRQWQDTSYLKETESEQCFTI